MSCPACGYPFDVHKAPADAEHGTPEPGDFSFCIGCGEALRFADDLSLRLVTPSEADLLPPGLRELIATSVARFRAEQKRRARGSS